MTAVPGPAAMPASRPASPLAPLRFAAVPAWTVACYAYWLLLAVAPGAATRRRRTVRVWARGVLRLLRIRVDWTGEIPAAPFALVTNHLGYLDIAVLASGLDVVFVAKREVSRWPVFGPPARAIGTIFVNRESARDVVRVSDLIAGAMESGRSVVLFAEGTSSPGLQVLPLRTALLEPLVRRGTPVATAALSYQTHPGDPPASSVLCWWGDMTFLPHLWNACSLRPSTARVAFGNAVTANDRRTLAVQLHRALSAHFTRSGHHD